MEFWIFLIVGAIVAIFSFWMESAKFSEKLKKYQIESDKYLKNKNFSFHSVRYLITNSWHYYYIMKLIENGTEQ